MRPGDLVWVRHSTRLWNDTWVLGSLLPGDLGVIVQVYNDSEAFIITHKSMLGRVYTYDLERA